MFLIRLIHLKGISNISEVVKNNKVLVHSSKFNFEIHLIKNPAKGPCTAVIKGMNYPQSKCVIVYPADDFINHTICLLYTSPSPRDRG